MMILHCLGVNIVLFYAFLRRLETETSHSQENLRLKFGNTQLLFVPLLSDDSDPMKKT